MIESNHFRICVILEDSSMILQAPHFNSIGDCTQYLLMYHHLVLDGERVEFVKDNDVRIYPIWRANKHERFDRALR